VLSDEDWQFVVEVLIEQKLPKMVVAQVDGDQDPAQALSTVEAEFFRFVSHI
jgi:hypothetical protein